MTNCNPGSHDFDRLFLIYPEVMSDEDIKSSLSDLQALYPDEKFTEHHHPVIDAQKCSW